MARAASPARATGSADTILMSVLTTLLLAAALLMVLRLATTGRISRFSPARARLASSSLRGSNTTLVVSAAALAGLAFSAASHADRLTALTGRVGGSITVALVVAVVALVAFRSSDAILGILGFSAEVIGTGLQHGAAAAGSVVVLAMLLIVLLGFIRGFVRPR
jgi:hypothetical protein